MERLYKNIAIIGAGSWGVAIANLLSDNSKVTVFHYKNSTVKYLKKTRIHPNLPKQTISKNIFLSESKKVDADLCILAIPVQHMRKSLKGFTVKSKDFLILARQYY